MLKQSSDPDKPIEILRMGKQLDRMLKLTGQVLTRSQRVHRGEPLGEPDEEEEGKESPVKKVSTTGLPELRNVQQLVGGHLPKEAEDSVKEAARHNQPGQADKTSEKPTQSMLLMPKPLGAMKRKMSAMASAMSSQILGKPDISSKPAVRVSDTGDEQGKPGQLPEGSSIVEQPKSEPPPGSNLSPRVDTDNKITSQSQEVSSFGGQPTPGIMVSSPKSALKSEKQDNESAASESQDTTKSCSSIIIVKPNPKSFKKFQTSPADITHDSETKSDSVLGSSQASGPGSSTDQASGTGSSTDHIQQEVAPKLETLSEVQASSGEPQCLTSEGASPTEKDDFEDIMKKVAEGVVKALSDGGFKKLEARFDASADRLTNLEAQLHEAAEWAESVRFPQTYREEMSFEPETGGSGDGATGGSSSYTEYIA